MRLLTKNRPRPGARGAWGSWVRGPPLHRALDTPPPPPTYCTHGVLTRAPLRCSPGVLHGPALRVSQPVTARSPGSSPGRGASPRTRPRVGAPATRKRTKQLSYHFHTPGHGCCLGTRLWKSATKWVQIKSPSELRTLAPGTLLASPPPELGPSLQSPGVQGKASLVFDLMPAGPSVAAQMFFFTYAHTRIYPLEYFSPSLYKCI